MSDDALDCVQQHAGRFRAQDFFPTPSIGGVPALSEAAAGVCTRGSRRCTTPGSSARCCRSSRRSRCRVVRDFYHKYTVDEHTLLTIRNLERLTEADQRPERGRFSRLLGELDRAGAARALAALPRHRQVDRRGPRGRERPHGPPDVRSDGPRRRGREPRGLPRRRAPQDVGRRVSPRHRGPGDRPPVRRPRRRRGAAQDALSADPGRCRGRQPARR